MTLAPSHFQALANAVLILHTTIVLFVIGGLFATLLGGFLRWAWVRNFWFRAAHLAAIGIVMLESWVGFVCPLTTLEQWLRVRAGQTAYEGDFVAYWLSRLMFYQAPPWVFITAYSTFAALVLASWLLVPPRRPRFWRQLAA